MKVIREVVTWSVTPSTIELLIHLVPSCSSIACRNYSSGLVDCALEDHEQLRVRRREEEGGGW
jgi:hypothetical protein